ncbi:Antitoxin DinJ [Actinomyces bovis]|uniref:Antitoxin DinJ n=1 Tax=Actinomyces bovis TaxID=1658 RepID=A0ABY1VRA1_9ACTO|nr:type II toxin-antitoxin system RelB/DinJ family antitoxin [Actinomyces bovis]SPT54186.1 Antitoxin DinJ [Actinomyces bovis]VEG56584.1 Antitoxin DinJ [Actinomyces israelii]
MASVTVRVDDETKERAAKIAEDFGFDLSSVTRAFYRQMVRENRIPLSLSYGAPNQESCEALAEAEQIAVRGTARFADADQVFDSLGI